MDRDPFRVERCDTRGGQDHETLVRTGGKLMKERRFTRACFAGKEYMS